MLNIRNLVLRENIIKRCAPISMEALNLLWRQNVLVRRNSTIGLGRGVAATQTNRAMMMVAILRRCWAVIMGHIRWSLAQRLLAFICGGFRAISRQREPRAGPVIIDPILEFTTLLRRIINLGRTAAVAAQWVTRIATSISDRMATVRCLLPRRSSASAREKSRSKLPRKANQRHPSLRASSPRRSRPAMDVVAMTPRHRLLP